MIDKSMKITVEITDILATTPGGIWVVVKKTGKPAWVSRRYSEFFNHCVRVPIWLAEKIQAIEPVKF